MDPRTKTQMCCGTPMDTVKSGYGDLWVIWCHECKWSFDYREKYSFDRMRKLIDDLLNPESLGLSATAEIRDRARECKGLDRVESD